MQLALVLHVSSFLVLRTLCFEEGMDNAEQYNKRISALSRKERDKNWFNNLMAQAKEASEKNLRSAQNANANYPNIRKMSYGVNVLLGKPPYEKDISYKLLDFDHEDDINNIKYLDYYNSNTCDEDSSESDVSYSYSSKSFNQQTSSYGFGFGVESTLGVPGAVSTEAELSLAFSKSKMSGSLRNSALRSTSRSIYSYGQKTLFKAGLNWDYMTKDAYDSHFLSECAGLGENPSDADVVGFFKKFGTHGYMEATFGKRCTSLMVMEGTSTKDEMEEWSTNTKGLESTFFWFHTEKSNEKEEKSGSAEGYNFTYSSSNNKCIGLATDNGSCQGTTLPVDNKELPEILHWVYKPIWEMNVPGLSVEAKNKMAGFFESVVEEIESCGTKNCDSNGVCPVSGYMAVNVDVMIDTDICICNDGYEGISCMETDAVVNLALTGKISSGARNANKAIDNKKGTNTGPINNLVVELAQFSKISRIVIWNSNSIFSTGLLEILDSHGIVVRKVRIPSTTESDKFDYNMDIEDNVMGKSVRITTDSVLSIAEVQVYGRNLQVRKLKNVDMADVNQSSTEKKTQKADKAVDSNKGTVSCTKQQNKSEPYWSVRFKKEEVIQRIVVWNRQKNMNYLSNSDVQILKRGRLTDSKHIDNARDEHEFEFDGARGDTVKIKKRKGRISLAEVDVYVYE